MPDDPRFFLSHVEVPLLTPRKRASFPSSLASSSSSSSRSIKRIRTRQIVRGGAREEREEEDDMDAVLPRRGMEVVELDEGLKLYGSGISKNLEDIGATLGPLERAVIGGQDHWISTKHLRQYSYWLAERQRLYIRRRDGQLPILNIKIPGKPDMPCWSLDPMFAHRVTNTYRHQDDFSQFIIEDVVRNYRPRPEPDLAYRTSGQDNRYNAAGEWIDNVEEQLFRVTLLRRFGKSETYKYFLRELGDIRWKTYTYERYYAVIKKKLRLFPHVACFTGSYQVHPPKQYGKGTPEGNAIASVEAFMTGNVPFPPYTDRPFSPLPATLASVNTLSEAYNYLSSWPGMGPYHSLQYALDLNYTDYVNLSTTEWMAGGRGAVNGLNLIIPTIKGRDKDINVGLVWLREQQWGEWARLGYTPVPQDLAPGMLAYEGVNLIDLENSLCLYQKYARRLRNTELYHMARGDNPELDWIGNSSWDPHRGENRATRTLICKPAEKEHKALKFWARVIQEFREEIETAGAVQDPREEIETAATQVESLGNSRASAIVVDDSEDEAGRVVTTRDDVIVFDDSEEEEVDELEVDELESDSEMKESERKPEVGVGVENSENSEVKPSSVADVKPLSVADVKPLGVSNDEHPDIKPKAELAS